MKIIAANSRANYDFIITQKIDAGLVLNDLSSNINEDNIVYYQWDFGDMNTSTQISPQHTYENYDLMLNEKYDGSVIDESKIGLARELARMNLTLNTYTQWYWKTDLLNLMNFLRLRADRHAQYEIREYADAMLDTVKKWVPITYDAFMDYRVGWTEVSAKGKKVIQQLIKGEEVSIEQSGLSKREWNEVMEAFDLEDKSLKWFNILI